MSDLNFTNDLKIFSLCFQVPTESKQLTGYTIARISLSLMIR